MAKKESSLPLPVQLAMDQSLSLPKHQQGLLDGAKRFVPSGPLRQQVET